MSEELLMRIQELATKRKELEQQLANATKQNVMLREALGDIASIKNRIVGGDWDEINDARIIAEEALAATEQKT